MSRLAVTLVAITLLCRPAGAQDSQVTQAGAWYVMQQKDAMTDEPQNTLITASVTSGQRLASSPVRGDFGFHCRSGLVLPVLLVKARYLMPDVSEATVQIRIAGGTPSPPASWEPRAVSSGVAFYGQDGGPLAEQLMAALTQDSAATFVVRAHLVIPGIDDATVTFAFKARGFAKVWPQCPYGSKR